MMKIIPVNGFFVKPFRLAVVPIVIAAALMFIPGHASAQNATPEAKSEEAPAGNAENGKQLFVKVGCFACHGTLAHGGTTSGPRLAGPPSLSYKAFVAYVRKPAEMPPYTEKVLSDQELTDIYTFLKSVPRSPDLKSIPLLNEK
jgi:mono/diheme cytochrome c family protein